MSRFITATALFLIFMVLALVSTTVVYFVVYGLIEWTCSSFSLPSRYSWLPIAITLFVFVVGVVTAIRQRLPDLADLSWDSGTQQDSPSQIFARRGFGRLWNVNPFGPQSMESITAIVAGFLCLGPSLVITAIVTFVQEIKEKN